MRQLFALLLAALLVVSIVPAAFARGGDDVGLDVRGDGSIDDSDDDSTDSDDSIEFRSETEVRSDDGMDRIREEYKDGLLRIREEHKDEFERIRAELRLRVNNSNITTADLVEARKAFLASVKERRAELREDRHSALLEIRSQIKADHERIVELRKEYKTEREEFMNARGNLKEECDDTASEDCREARKELNNEARDFMGNAAEQMLRIIESMKTRVESNEHIDAETAAGVVTQLEVRAAAIEAAQAKIDALGNSTNVTATKEAAAELRTAWQEARVTIRLSEGLIAHARFQEFLDQLTSMETRFEEARDQLEADGKDVTQLDADLAAFSAKIDAATETYESARDSYIEAMATADTEAEANVLLRSTRAQLKDARSDLEDARQDLRAVIKDIRGLDTGLLKETAAKVKTDADAQVSVEAEIEAEVSE
jgi:hypothetical protein